MANKLPASSLVRRGEQVLISSQPKDYGRGLEDVSNWGQLLGGGALVLYGLKRMSLGGLFIAGVGAGLAYNGAKNSGLLKGGWKRMALHTAASQPVEIEKSVTIDKPIHEVYAFWRNLENLPLFMHHIHSVDEIDRRRSHWIANLRSGITLEWDAEIIDERENESLAWRTTEGSDLYNEGFVVFAEAPGRRGTEVHARIVYRPPAGAFGAKVAEFFNKFTEQMLKEDLRRFKHILETGEIPTTSGQSSARDRELPNGGTRDTLLH